MEVELWVAMGLWVAYTLFQSLSRVREVSVERGRLVWNKGANKNEKGGMTKGIELRDKKPLGQGCSHQLSC